MTLADKQIQFNGLTMGPGTPYRVDRFGTLGHHLRTSDQPRPNGPGLYLGPDYPEGLPVAIDLVITGNGEADTLVNYEALAAAWSTAGTEGFIGSSPLIFKRPGQVQRRYDNGRARDLVADMRPIIQGWMRASLTFVTEGPFELADTATVVDLVSGGSNVTLANGGNHAAAVTWDVYGQVTNPGVIRSEADRFDLTTAIGDLDWYRVRTDARTVTRASDAGNLYSTFAGTWLEIPAGGALFRAVGTAPTSAATKVRATWRDTWWV